MDYSRQQSTAVPQQVPQSVRPSPTPPGLAEPRENAGMFQGRYLYSHWFRGLVEGTLLRLMAVVRDVKSNWLGPTPG